MTVYDSQPPIGFLLTRHGEVFGFGQKLARLLVPHVAKNLVQFVHCGAFNAHVHVMPIANLWNAFNIVVGHIHASRVGNSPVDDHYFAVITRNDVVDPGETDGVKLHQTNAQRIDGVMHVMFYGLVIR